MMRLRAWIWAALVLVLAGAAAQQYSRGAGLQTSILALLPQTERDPLAEEAIQRLEAFAGGRSVFLVAHGSAEQAKSAARRFAGELRRHAVFRQVHAELPALDLSRLMSVYSPHRFHLLTAEDRRQLEHGGTAALEHRLLSKLNSPLGYRFASSLAEDPYGHFDSYVYSLPLGVPGLEVEDGLLMVRDSGTAYVLVTAELAGSAHDSRVQEQAIAAIAQAEQLIRASDAAILRTGTVHFASAAREAAKSDVDMIGWGSLAGISLLLLLAFRSVRPLLLGLLSVGVGVCTGAVAVIASYDELHLLTLVFGASLIGEAIDYSIQYFAVRLAMQRDWDAAAGLRLVWPALTIALATSLLSYAALMLTRFPALAQIALFASAGLTGAYVTTVLLLPALLRKPQSGDTGAVLRRPDAAMAWWQRRVGRRTAILIMAGMVVAFLPGWLQMQAADDVRLLVNPPPALLQQETEIRRLTGVGNSSQFFLVQGPTAQALLEREEALISRLAPLKERGELARVLAVSEFVPSAAHQRANHALLGDGLITAEEGAKQQLSRAGFRDEAIDAYLLGFRDAAARVLTPETWLAAPVSAPVRHLWIGETGRGSVASVVIPQGFRSVAALAEAAAGLEGVTLVDKPASVSLLFKRYRELGSGALVVALTLVYGVLLSRYGWARGLIVTAPTAGALIGTLGVFGYAGIPLTFFTVMGLMLVLGVGVNYSVFLYEGAQRRGAALIGVALSAVTTLLSFGLLALSSMPALQRFGLTLLAGIGFAVLLAPTVLSWGRREACR